MPDHPAILSMVKGEEGQRMPISSFDGLAGTYAAAFSETAYVSTAASMYTRYTWVIHCSNIEKRMPALLSSRVRMVYRRKISFPLISSQYINVHNAMQKAKESTHTDTECTLKPQHRKLTKALDVVAPGKAGVTGHSALPTFSSAYLVNPLPYHPTPRHSP